MTRFGWWKFASLVILVCVSLCGLFLVVRYWQSMVERSFLKNEALRVGGSEGPSEVEDRKERGKKGSEIQEEKVGASRHASGSQTSPRPEERAQRVASLTKTPRSDRPDECRPLRFRQPEEHFLRVARRRSSRRSAYGDDCGPVRRYFAGA